AQRVAFSAGRYKQHVAGLDVAVEHAAAMTVLHGIGERRNDHRGRPGSHQLILPQPLLEIAPLAVRRGDVAHWADLAAFEDRQDMRMIERRGGPCLAQQAIVTASAAEYMQLRDLERNVSPQQQIAGKINDSETALTENLEQFEPADLVGKGRGALR